MDLIAAVYDDWGIGFGGTQPIALHADRKFFRQATEGATVLVGRKTLASFPGGQPLPRRVNVVLSHSGGEIPGATVCRSLQEAVALTRDHPNVFVIGGGSIYRQFLPLCSQAYITKVHTTPESDTFLPNLDQDPSWTLAAVLQSGTEGGIRYEMCLYQRR